MHHAQSADRFFKPLADTDRHRLSVFRKQMEAARETFTGYPCNQYFDYTELLPFMEFALNNVGDPYSNANTLRMHTRDFEKEVLAWFADLLHAPKDDYWGYVTNGGTEGNLYGLYLARELYPDAIFYFSEETHYSVAKNLSLLRVRHIMLTCQPNGEMNYDDLRETLKLHRDAPAVILANIGTTMKGAVDNVATIRDILQQQAIRHFYIHADAALSGMILPFVDNPPPFHFGDGIHSISISGHKLIGSPIPCGIVLAHKRHVDRIARAVEYVGVLDTTITGSRNAITPLILWYALHRAGRTGFAELVAESLALADYAIAAFARIGIKAWRNPHSITVVVPRPSAAILNRWQMAPEHGIAHIITLPHVTREVIDTLVAEYQADRQNLENKA